MKPIATTISPPHKRRWYDVHLLLRKPLSKKVSFALKVCSLIAMFMCYEMLSWQMHEKNPDDTTVPSISQLYNGFVFVTTPSVKSRGHIWLLEDMEATYTRFILGFSVGVMISFVIGLLMGCFPVCEAFFDWPTRMLAKVPPTGVVAIFFIIWSTGLQMFVALIAFGIAPILIQAIYQAIKYDVPDEFIYQGYTLGGSNFEIVTNIVVPNVLPRILEAARLQVASAVVYLVAAELALAPSGFGSRMRVQFRSLDFSIVYDYVLILAISGFLFDQSINLLRLLMCRWYGSGK